MKVTDTTRTRTFEGTPEEYREYVKLQTAQEEETAQPEPQTLPKEEQKAGGEQAQTYEQYIRGMLKRMPVPNGQKQIYGALYQAGDEGLRRSQLVATIGRRDAELSGIFGALGRRLNNTSGFNELSAGRGHSGIGLILRIDAVEGEWSYALLPEFRRVIEEAGLVETLRKEGYLS